VSALLHLWLFLIDALEKMVLY